MQIGYLYDTLFLAHDTGNHIEISNRARRVNEMVKTCFDVLDAHVIKGIKEDIYRVHDASYVDWVESGYAQGVRNIMSSDTVLSGRSFEVALSAACSTKNVIEDFIKNRYHRAFLNLRPPGHHAEFAYGQGFCIFNNVAMMAKYAQDAGYKKVLIIDFDVHHGNGTQEIFYEDDTVFYFSTHERDNYPFTGTAQETGKDKGEGFTLNIPYADAIDDTTFASLFTALPKDFEPDIVLVSAGYDMMGVEQISSTQITQEGLAKMIHAILEYAKKRPVAFLLEGGYEVDSLVKSVETTIRNMIEY